MRTIIAALLIALSPAAFADWVIMTPEEQELNNRFPALATRDEAVTAFNSRHFLLQQKAIEWLIVHRDIATWNSFKSQKEKLKEVSRQLYPILDHLSDQPAEPTKPLTLILPQTYFDLLVKKGEEVPPRHEYAYLAPPVDEVLYQILAEGLNRFPNTNELTANAARLLLEYRAPSDKHEHSVKLKAVLGTPEQSTDSNPEDHPLQSPEPTQRQTTPQPSLENPKGGSTQPPSDRSTITWIVAITAVIGITFAALATMRKKS